MLSLPISQSLGWSLALTTWLAFSTVITFWCRPLVFQFCKEFASYLASQFLFGGYALMSTTPGNGSTKSNSDFVGWEFFCCLSWDFLPQAGWHCVDREMRHVICVSLRSYKTNWLVWVISSIIILLPTSYDIQCVFALFSGEARVADLLTFDFIAPLVIAVVLGWLAQCAIVIILSRRKRDAKH